MSSSFADDLIFFVVFEVDRLMWIDSSFSISIVGLCDFLAEELSIDLIRAKACFLLSFFSELHTPII